jgi:HAD superfamily hydrolase (TIGR01509 family)
MRSTDLDAVTVDAFGTLITLRRTVATLTQVTGRPPDDVAAAFKAEVAFYQEHAVEGRDPDTLADLRRRCVAVFNGVLGTALGADEFVAALEYEALPGVREALATIRANGLSLAVVANWDYALAEPLARLGLRPFFSTVVTSAEAGAAKPDARPLQLALERLGVRADRTLHIGDRDVDEQSAAAAGTHFAHAPLPEAVAALL